MLNTKHPHATLRRELRDAYIKGYIIHLDFHETFESEMISVVFPSTVSTSTMCKLKEYVESTFAVSSVTLRLENWTMRIIVLNQRRI